MQLEQLTKKLNRPEYKHDTAAKAYIVYDEMGNEHSRHKYKDIWNSSPAMRAAQQDVNKLKSNDIQKQKLAYEARPLSKFEERYRELEKKLQKYMDAIKSGILDDETTNLYYETMSGWSDEMSRMVDNNLIRSSVIMGNYKPTQ